MSGTYVRTPEMCKAISLRMKGKRYGLGHKMTEQHKKELSLRMLGNQYTKGLKQTEEAKRKISEANKGKSAPGRGTYVRSEELKQAQSARMIGNKNRAGQTHSLEEREKARQSMLLFYDTKDKKETKAENLIYRLPNGDLRPDYFEVLHGTKDVYVPKPKTVPIVVVKPPKSVPLIEFNRKREPNAYALGPKPNHPWSYEAQAAKRKK